MGTPARVARMEKLLIRRPCYNYDGSAGRSDCILKKSLFRHVLRVPDSADTFRGDCLS